MARCLELQDFSVESGRNWCRVTMEAWDPETLAWFRRIIASSFPASGFVTQARPSMGGFLALQQQMVLIGNAQTPEDEIEDLMTLLAGSLTIEDSLDESHSLAHHKDEDGTTGRLKPSALGRLVYDAKYNSGKGARERIGQGMCEFIERHPRYRKAAFIAPLPRHVVGRVYGVAGRLSRQIAESLELSIVQIERVVERPSQKNIVDADRVKGVRMRFSNQRRSMVVDDDLRGEHVILIDDLYGSGATMEEASRALREAGAKTVVGLTATKQRLFSGVRAGG